MKLNFAIICDNAFTDSRDRLNIIQTLDTIIAPDFPAIHPRLTIVTNFSVEKKDDRNKEYIQAVIIKHKNEETKLAELKTKNKLKKGINNLQFIAYFVGLKFHEEGLHDVIIKLNDKEISQISFQVKKSPAQ